MQARPKILLRLVLLFVLMALPARSVTMRAVMDITVVNYPEATPTLPTGFYPEAFVITFEGLDLPVEPFEFGYNERVTPIVSSLLGTDVAPILIIYEAKFGDAFGEVHHGWSFTMEGVATIMGSGPHYLGPGGPVDGAAITPGFVEDAQQGMWLLKDDVGEEESLLTSSIPEVRIIPEPSTGALVALGLALTAVRPGTRRKGPLLFALTARSALARQHPVRIRRERS